MLAWIGIDVMTFLLAVGTTVTDLAYGPLSLNNFDLYLPADSSRGAYRLVVYIHAGGLTSGDKADDEMFGQYSASRGCSALWPQT